jgi:hypothetical protein
MDIPKSNWHSQRSLVHLVRPSSTLTNKFIPIPAGFFEERRDIYNLYPLLVHVRLFGGGYVGQVGRILERFGY